MRTSCFVPSLRPRPGPIATASAVSAASSTASAARGEQAPGRVLGQRPLDRLEQPRLDHRQRRLGRGDRDVARVGAERGERGQHRRAGQPARAADDEHAARRGTSCSSGSCAAARAAPTPGTSACSCSRGREPDRGDVHRARVDAARRDREPDLRRAERDGRPSRAPPRPAPRPSRRRRPTARRSRRPGFPLALMRSIMRAASSRGASSQADPEQRVDDRRPARRGRRRPRPRSRRGPPRARTRAQTRPSPPLLPPPQTTVTRPGNRREHDLGDGRCPRAPSAPRASPRAPPRRAASPRP